MDTADLTRELLAFVRGGSTAGAGGAPRIELQASILPR